MSLNQVVDWDAPKGNALLEKAVKAIREKLKGPDVILSTSFIFKFDCLQPECQMDYADPEAPELEWSKLGENFAFSTDAGVEKEAKDSVVSIEAAFSEHFEKPRATFKVEKDGSGCVVLHLGITIKRRLEGKVSAKFGGREIELFGGKDAPTELSVGGKIKICCCVSEETGEEPPKGAPKDGNAEKTATGVTSKCDYYVTVRRWDEDPKPRGAAHQLYWECHAPLGSCGKPKKVGSLPLVEPQSGIPK
ncbi:MAG TPA: hypothetical protein VN881_06270 [Candidatus Acidoferrales bacterium]|nr:hypothetical protein [Candidatus Acidoferrales bacterium]